MNAYDTAIVMSGDTDYIPVLDILNTMGKATVVVGVRGQNLFQFMRHSDNQIQKRSTVIFSQILS